ncbi:MAG: DUF1566 domain-containing protein [Pseudomonadota bacterium]
MQLMTQRRTASKIFLSLALATAALSGCERLRGSGYTTAYVSISEPAGAVTECAPVPVTNVTVSEETECDMVFPLHLSAPLDHDLSVYFLTGVSSLKDVVSASTDLTNYPDIKNVNLYDPSNAGKIITGRTEGSLTVKIKGDKFAEPTEAFLVLLLGTSDSHVKLDPTLNANFAHGRILDDSDAAPILQFADTNNQDVPENAGVHNVRLFLVDKDVANAITGTLDKDSMWASGYNLSLPVHLTVSINGALQPANDIYTPPVLNIPAHTLDPAKFKPDDPGMPAWIDVPVYIRDDNNPNTGSRVVTVTIDTKVRGVDIPGIIASNKLSSTFTIVESDGTDRINGTGVTQCADDTTYQTCIDIDIATTFPEQDAHHALAFNFDKSTVPGCVIDKTTGLLWEIKTTGDNAGYRHRDYLFDWYESSSIINGGSAGHVRTDTNTNCGGLAPCTTQAYVKKANSEKICGHTGWRLPKMDELVSIVDYGVSTPFGTAKKPLINTDFGPTPLGQYWTATTAAGNPEMVWVVNFGDDVGNDGYDLYADGSTQIIPKIGSQTNGSRYVRLVTKYVPAP